MIVQTIAGCVLALVGMLVAFGLVRLAANVVVLVIAVATCGSVIYCILERVWSDWPTICISSLATGFAGALLCLPVLPFSSFYRKKG